jgi:hypothetical protein
MTVKLPRRTFPSFRLCLATLALSSSLAACERAPDPQPAAAGDAAAPTAPAQATSTAVVTELLLPAGASTSPPADSAALATAFAQPDDGSVERALPDGRQVGFWHGYAYRSGEQERYTAFVYASAATDGPAPPGQQVDLAQITYTLRDGVWQANAPQSAVGRFGAAGRAPSFDRQRIALTYTVSADEALLALPASMAATGGAQVATYELFRHAPGSGEWRHVGSIRAGIDHSAACDAGAATPADRCVRNTGGLRFLQDSAGARPAIVVTFSGSVRADDGTVRDAGPQDAKTYRYDEASGAYAESPRQ